MLNRQEAEQSQLFKDEMTAEDRLRARLKWGKAVEDLTLAMSDYIILANEINLNGKGPYIFTDQEERNLSEFENFLRGMRIHIDAALAVKLRFEKSFGAQQATAEAAQEDNTQATEEQLRDRLEWGKKLENLIVALSEFHEAEEKLFREGPHAFNKVEEDTLDDFNNEIAGAESKLSDLMAVKLRFEREHNL